MNIYALLICLIVLSIMLWYVFSLRSNNDSQWQAINVAHKEIHELLKVIMDAGDREAKWEKRCQEAEHEGTVLYLTLSELRDQLRTKGVLNRLPVRFIRYITYTERVIAKHLKITTPTEVKEKDDGA